MAKQYVEISENDYPSKEKIWDRLYQCRDFELSHFWQKSVFVFSIFIVCFTGYGGLVSAAIDPENKKSLFYIYQYMCGVSLLGIITSILWIYMMKGSKAWYEVYEKSIYAIECEIFKDSNKKYIEGEFAKRMSKNFNNNFFDNKSGAFSPSKINMVIGWIMLIVWCICGFFGMYNLNFSVLEVPALTDSLLCIGVVIVVTVVLQWVISFFYKK